MFIDRARLNALEGLDTSKPVSELLSQIGKLKAHKSCCFITLYTGSITFITFIGRASFLTLRLERGSNLILDPVKGHSKCFKIPNTLHPLV